MVEVINMADFKETCVEYIDLDKHATFCSSEKKWINKIIRLHQAHPEEVEIICVPEENEGVILAHIPKSWLKISPPKKMNLTEEQKAERAERMRKALNR